MLQKELASRVGCSVTALQKIERDERRPSRQLAERLAEALDIPGEQRAAFLQVARGERMAERLAALPSVVAPRAGAQPLRAPSRGELPSPATPLVGREAELANLSLLLRDPQCRLLTLTGPGGIGKTRLALAAQQHGAFAHGIAFVALAPLLGREQVVTAIADALGCALYGTRDPAEQLVQYLRDKALLLLLDNFEHLLADAACADLIGQLLRGADKLKLLITSREPLDIQEEWVFDVQGLPTPLSATADEVEASSAARLFQQRARQAQASYTLSAEDNPAVVRICQLVGGVPLGIELAATWMRTLSCQEIADEIQRNLDFLATRARDVPERHRSIRAVFDQSWALLAAEERRVLRRVAVFRGGFTRAAAEEVAGASLALLAALVAKSLLRRTEGGRYDLHGLVHQYALDQLRTDVQEEAETRARHSRCYARLLEQRGVAFKGPGQAAVVAELAADLANIRLAWEWACTRQLAAELSQAADTLFWLYEAQSNFREGIPLFGQAVESLQQAAVGTSPPAEGARGLALGQALSYQGFFCFRQGQHPLSRTLLQRSVALLGGFADDEARAALSTAAAFLGIVTYRMGEYMEGRRLLGEGLAIKRALGDQWGAALCLRQLGLAAYSQGEYAEAHRLLSESLVLSRAMGNPWSLAFSLNFLSRVAYAQGAYDEAQLLLQEGLALSRSLADRFNIASAQNGLGMVHRARGQASEARRAFEESIAIWREIGDRDSLAQCLNQLGETLLGSGDRLAARECFVEALAVARDAQVAPVMLDALLGVASLRAEQGALETPLELVLHILEHPSSTQEARGRAELLRAALERHLSPQQIKVIRARGRERTLRELAAPEHIAALLASDAAATDRAPALDPAAASHANRGTQTDLPPPHPPQAQPAPPRNAAPLLATKLHVPALRAQIVPRPRLVERLQAVLQSKLTLVVAPAGYGKTTLLTQGLGAGDWELAGAASSSHPLTPNSRRVAWVSLDAADSDPLRFWSYVIAALDTLQPGGGALALELLRSPQPPSIETVLTSILNELDAGTADLALVLDDYHLIDNPSIHTALAFLLDHLPSRLHLLLATRADPPLPLTRLRAKGQLAELRAVDLRFTLDEAAAFLTTLLGLSLSAGDVVALEARTEGWVAGLQFAALAMRDRADLSNFVVAFTGSHRFVVDFLAEEVFTRQPRHIQTFLLQTAILDRMCGPLCDAVVLGIGDWRLEARELSVSPSLQPPASNLSAYSQLMLEQLERANLFVVSLDDERHWYRYHQLFGEVLRARLYSGAAAGEVAALHGRASAWYERSGLQPEAIQHALAAQDWERAGRLIEKCAWPVAYQGQIHTVLGWFGALPAAFMQTQPPMCVLHALLLIHADQLEAAEARLHEAEQALRPDMPEELVRSIQGRILTTRANISFYRGDLRTSVDLGRQALDSLPAAYGLPRAAAIAFAAQAFLVTGDATPATERAVAEVAPAARAAGNRFVELRGFTLLAELQALQGRLQAAATSYREAEQLGPEPTGLRRMIGNAAYYFGLGDVLREWNNLAAAEQLLTEGMDRATGRVTANAVYLDRGFRALARLRQATGDHAGAAAALAALADLGRRRGFDPLILARCMAAQARLRLAQGDLDAAVRWAEVSGLRPSDEVSFPRELEYLTLARVLIGRGRNDPTASLLADALSLLDRLLEAAEASARMGSAIEILVLRALASQARGGAADAQAALERALALAEPEGYVRVFADEGQPMAALLEEAQRHSIAPGYAAKLLAAFPERLEARDLRLGDAAQASSLKPQASDLVEPLTDRELEILRLIAEGHSNQAIADTLIIAVSTVKRHINNIYGKLGVQSRTQALLRARELQIL